MQDAAICALGFRVNEYISGGNGTWESCAEPVGNACMIFPKPHTEDDLWALCEKMGIETEE